jgi:hypothetical protein
VKLAGDAWARRADDTMAPMVKVLDNIVGVKRRKSVEALERVVEFRSAGKSGRRDCCHVQNSSILYSLAVSLPGPELAARTTWM